MGAGWCRTSLYKCGLSRENRMPGAVLRQKSPLNSGSFLWPSHQAHYSFWPPGGTLCTRVGSSLSAGLPECLTGLSVRNCLLGWLWPRRGTPAARGPAVLLGPHCEAV